MLLVYMNLDMIKYVETWDSYSLAATYIIVLNDIFRKNPNAYTEQAKEYKEKYEQYMNVLKSVLYCAPDQRPSLKTTIKQLSKIER